MIITGLIDQVEWEEKLHERSEKLQKRKDYALLKGMNKTKDYEPTAAVKIPSNAKKIFDTLKVCWITIARDDLRLTASINNTGR